MSRRQFVILQSVPGDHNTSAHSTPRLPLAALTSPAPTPLPPLPSNGRGDELTTLSKYEPPSNTVFASLALTPGGPAGFSIPGQETRFPNSRNIFNLAPRCWASGDVHSLHN
ncbi:hypothetical protein E2C01_043268 [Portunus trituberculatus]|uniref:Uncharacterized protein n=1 Tax=Portunus trituberculatus TaxID=210409 RepID=A0A5B7FV96_PORTR|nr:hypothetical protein [Portunus trituberculatus]